MKIASKLPRAKRKTRGGSKPCPVCGYQPEWATRVQDMTEEEKCAASSMFKHPNRTRAECYKEFLRHRAGHVDDVLPDSLANSQPNTSNELQPGVCKFDPSWYGVLCWWKGRETGAPDPTLPRKGGFATRLNNWFSWIFLIVGDFFVERRR